MSISLNTIFLIGGGWHKEAFKQTYAPFIDASTNETGRRIIQIIALESESNKDETGRMYREPFERLSVAPDELTTIFVFKNRPLTAEMLTSVNPTGIFVCGGTTPLYQEILCADTGLKDFIIARQLPYGGFSAGSAIAAKRAVVGGWKLNIDGVEKPVVDEDVSENLDIISVRDGLGFFPFSIDVHCGQWGTITRLIHAVDSGMIETGLGIDENTMLQVDNGSLSVHGLGQIYKIQRNEADKITIEIFGESDYIDLPNQ